MKYAIIDGGTVANIIEADAEFAASIGAIDATGGAIGDLWDGAVFTKAPAPVESTDEKRTRIQSEIEALERNSLLNRGSREMQLFQLEERAAQFAAANGVPVEMVLATNIYYGKLKALDGEAKALRDQLS